MIFRQKLSLDASDISRIIDGENALVDVAKALVIVGNEGDEIMLYGDFDANQDAYTLIDEVPMLFSQVSEGDVSLYFNSDTALTIHETDGGVSQYGIGTDDLLTGTANSET